MAGVDWNGLASALKASRVSPSQCADRQCYLQTQRQWKQTVKAIGRELSNANPEFKREIFYDRTGYYDLIK